MELITLLLLLFVLMRNTMKIQVRQGLFETNSSSTHSLVMFKGSDWELFKEGKMVIENSFYSNKLIRREDVPEGKSIFDPKSSNDIFFYDYIPYEAWINMNDYTDGYEVIMDKVEDSNGIDYTVVASIYVYE